MPRIRGSLADRLEVLLPSIVYAAITLTGATTSSLGISALREQTGHPLGTMLGAAQGVRSDEWLTAAPIELGVISHGSPVVSPLAHGPDLIYQVSSGGFFETLLFFEGNLLRLGPVLPDAMVFAAFRAFPLLLMVLTLPPLLRRLGATRPLSWLGVVLTLLAPASMWWSFIPIRVLAFGVAGSYLLILARDRFVAGSRVAGVLWAVVAGACIARLGTYYVPWGLTMGIPVAAAATVYLLSDAARWRAGLAALGTGAVSSIVLVGGTFLDNRSALSAELSTVYPGLRRAAGAALSPHELFGAPGLSVMQHLSDPVTSNKSEISSGFLLCAVWALVLWGHRRSDLGRPLRWSTGLLAVATALWTSWAMVDWGSLGSKIPVLSLVIPSRAAQTVGFLAAILACLVVAQVSRESRKRIWLVAGAACALVTAYGVSDLEGVFPQMSTVTVWLAALVTGALVAAVTRWPEHWLPVAATAVAVALIGFRVNPVIFGLGDLRASDAAHTAQRLAAQARADHGFVATDSPLTAALLVANGVPSLTGYQVTGPVRSAWERLDPTDRYEHRWNRGASYLRMTFDGVPGKPPRITNPGNDIVNVSTDPCTLAQSFRVTRIVSVAALNQPCLAQVDTFRWNDAVNRVYEVRPTR